jgi:hypothetical protein
MPAPAMIAGMRQPQSVRLEDIRKSTEAAQTLAMPAVDASSGVNVYISTSRSYLVEVLNVKSYVHEGERIPARRVAAQFVEGVYRNDERDPELRRLIDERLQRNKYFGKFGDNRAHFWLLSDMKEQTEATRIERALDTLRSLPREQVEKFVADLQQGDADDHQFEPAAATSAAEAAAQRTTKPIKPAA